MIKSLNFLFSYFTFIAATSFPTSPHIIKGDKHKLSPIPTFELGIYSILYTHSKYVGVCSRTWLPYRFGLQISYTLGTLDYKLLYLINRERKHREYIGIGFCDWLKDTQAGYMAPAFFLGGEMQFFSYPFIFSPEVAFGVKEGFSSRGWELGFNLSLYKPLITPKVGPVAEKWRYKEKRVIYKSIIVGAGFGLAVSSFSWNPIIRYEKNYLKLMPIFINTVAGGFSGFLTGKMASSWARGERLSLALLKGAVAGMVGGIVWDTIFLGTFYLYSRMGGKFPKFGSEPCGMTTGMVYQFLVGMPLVGAISVGIIGGGVAGICLR